MIENLPTLPAFDPPALLHDRRETLPMRHLHHRPGSFVGGFWAIAIVLGSPWVVKAGDQGGPQPSAESLAFFEAKVRPILADHCWKCHDGKKSSNGLRLDSRAALLQGGDDGPSLVPGDPDKSPLVAALRYQGDHKMPPKAKLGDAEIESISQWVKMGAPWPVATVASDQAKADLARTHWSFQPVRDPKPPMVENSTWATSPIDAFILSKLEGKKLAPSPKADKRTLIRRASFDLTGLPPSPAEVDAFLKDEAPDAFAMVVDRLLASPRYGERWGRHWLDVARYADTKGYVFNQERRYPYSYTYRDYVIQAFNDDLPYDQFIVEQLAADRLKLGDNPRPLAALGFLTVGRRFLNDKNDIIDDRIDVVTRGLLGLSVTCARCHDHKFDPIPTEDYYSLHGVFASSDEPDNLPALPNPIPEADKAAYDRERQTHLDNVAHARSTRKHQIEGELRDNLAALVEASYAIEFNPDRAKVEDSARAHKVSPERLRFVSRRLGKIFAKDAKGNDPVLTPWRTFANLPVDGFEGKAAEVARSLATQADIDPVVAKAFADDPPKTMADVAKRYGTLFERAARAYAPNPEVGPPAHLASPDLAAIHARLVVPETSPIVIPAEALDRVFDRAEREKIEGLNKKVAELDVAHPGSPARAMVLVDSPNPVNPHVFIRGNQGRPGKQIPRRFLRVLAPGGEARPFTEGSGRLEMARAIVQPDNPLTPRVMVNRIWHEHFGAGLVTTPSDFGIRGEPPTHPELLDFLARRFVDGGWSVKAMHRLILLSSTYQQVSDRRDDGFLADPANQLLWRQNRRRLDFESMRDGVLEVAGKLDVKMGGRPVELFEAKSVSLRRTVYGYVDRYDLDPTFRTFDFPSPDISAPSRPLTTVPQQSLFMMNSLFLLDQAKALANRPDLPASTETDQRINRLYLTLFGRPAETHEVELGRRFLESRPKPEDPKSPSAWEEYAQVLLSTNEFMFLD